MSQQIGLPKLKKILWHWKTYSNLDCLIEPAFLLYPYSFHGIGWKRSVQHRIITEFEKSELTCAPSF